MTREIFAAFAFACVVSHTAAAGEVSGKITIGKSISARNLVPAVYGLRGMAIQETSTQDQKTSEFERIAVWLEPDKPLEPAAPAVAIMEQRDRRFEPALLILPIGSTVEFPNTDPIFHNIFSLSRTQSFDLGYYPKGQSRKVRFARPGVVQVYCHIHSSMHAVIVVVSSPWFGKPDRNGDFSWPVVPPGNYQLVVWQKTLGLLRRKIVVPENAPLRLNITLPHEDLEN
ncbi:MAG TPA: carboxypeptidase regulatory-like domain-containing protein [Bryobacteraceae bacterium]|nr:carboxypeptidase regulatory-like domain-containing protein [Bryobacteraceae bacterium]